METFRYLSRLFTVLCFSFLIVSCATRPSDPGAAAEYDRLNDPLEPTNRVIFAINEGLNQALFTPIAKIYNHLPEGFRKTISNEIEFVGLPADFANALLQGEGEVAKNALKRLFINGTFGFLGMFDPATDMGIPKVDENFGETLAVWGVPEGPYLVLPILGPTNLRDAFGKVPDSFMDPLSYAYGSQGSVDAASVTRRGIEGEAELAEYVDVLEDIKRDSLDFYATIRSLQRQRRENTIRDGQAPDPLLEDDESKCCIEPLSFDDDRL